jgi:predicted acylesterase/phospholipase RssA
LALSHFEYSTMNLSTPISTSPYRILSLDGGGAKGFYTLGVLKEIEALTGQSLHERFDLLFGTSTGAIIAALLALGTSVDEIHRLYKEYVPVVMKRRSPAKKSKALEKLTAEVFGANTFTDVKTDIGIVATHWVLETPMIFKGEVAQAHGRRNTFVPGFGCTIADAVRASCSAYPFVLWSSTTCGQLLCRAGISDLHEPVLSISSSGAPQVRRRVLSEWRAQFNSLVPSCIARRS